jgi:ABC-type nitrate/sulfonate/bicarbonate transport system substrate-binding protein
MFVRNIALLIFLLAYSLPSFAQERVRIGVSSRGFGSLPLFVADKKGFYGKYGFRPETILLRSSVAVPALLSGDLDFYNGFQPAVSAAMRGIPIKLVMMGAEKVQMAPEQVKRMIKALIESQRFIRSQKDESAKLIGEWMSVDAATADNLYKNLGGIFSNDGTLTESALRASVQMESELAKTKFTAPLSTIFDNRLLLEAQQELRKDGTLK